MGRLRRVNRDEEYGGARQPVDLEAISAAINDIQAKLLRPLRIGKGTLYTLIAQVFPASTITQPSGLTSVAGNSSLSFESMIPSRITSIELWNYDGGGNAVTVRYDSPGQGGSIGTPFYLAGNSYRELDINLPGPATRVTVINNNGTAVNVQVVFNGL